MVPHRPTSKWSIGRTIAAILAITVNLGFIAFLVFSVTWQNRAPEPVSVELYAPQLKVAEKVAPPKPAPEPPKPEPEALKPPPEPVKPTPEPPKPLPKVEPPPGPTPAEIALKTQQAKAERAKQEKDKREADKREADKREADKREADKRDLEKKKLEEKRVAETRERQAREEVALKAQAEREAVAAAKAATAAQTRADDDYRRKIQAKIKGNVVVPPDISGNPEAIFDVVQLPTGEIIDTQLRKSSGVRAYDEAVQRAIIKASPLPRPDPPALFQRGLTLKFRPAD
ncbi:MAG: TonB C-terminal domain-containing protein [Casimicrobiaceae bacterium]